MIKNWQMTTGILLVAAIPLSIGFWSGWRRQPPEALQIESTQLDVGVIRTGRPFTHQIVVRNASSRAVVIPRVNVSCACTNVSPDSFRLLPDGDITLNVTIDPEILRRSLRGADEGEFQITLALFEQGEKIPRQWVLSGTLKPALVLKPRVLAFFGPDESVVGLSGSTTAAVARLSEPEHQLALAAKVERFDVVCERDSTNTAIWQVKVTPHARDATGSFEEMIWLAVRNASGTLVGEWPLHVKGRVESPLTVMPRVLDLFPSGDAVMTHEVVIHSNTGKTFRVAANQPAADLVGITPASTHWASQHLLTLEFAVGDSADKGELRLAVEYEDGRSGVALLNYTIHHFEEQRR